MSEGKFGEPWALDHSCDDEDAPEYAYVMIIDQEGSPNICREPRASRVVACVNAFAGIEDPAQFMEAVRAVTWFDWTSNDPDSVEAMAALRAMLPKDDAREALARAGEGK